MPTFNDIRSAAVDLSQGEIRTDQLMDMVRDYTYQERGEAWEEGYRSGWSDRTHSIMRGYTAEQEHANKTRNPYARAALEGGGQ